MVESAQILGCIWGMNSFRDVTKILDGHTFGNPGGGVSVGCLRAGGISEVCL